MRRVLSPRVWAVFCFVLGLGLTGCGKADPAEVSSSKPAPVAPPTRQLASDKQATPPPTGKEPAVSGPAVLTLRATGAFVDPDGKPIASPDEAESFLKKERAQGQQARTVFRAERQTDVFRVVTALALYRKAGFREVELQDAAAAARKGPILTLAEPARPADEPANPASDKPGLQLTLVVHANGSGSQAGDVRDMVLKTGAGEAGLPRGKWRAALPRAISGAAASFSDKDVCEIQADPKLTYGAVLEVIEVCSSAGLKHIELSILGGKRPEE